MSRFHKPLKWGISFLAVMLVSITIQAQSTTRDDPEHTFGAGTTIITTIKVDANGNSTESETYRDVLGKTKKRREETTYKDGRRQIITTYWFDYSKGRISTRDMMRFDANDNKVLDRLQTYVEDGTLLGDRATRFLSNGSREVREYNWRTRQYTTRHIDDVNFRILRAEFPTTFRAGTTAATSPKQRLVIHWDGDIIFPVVLRFYPVNALNGNYKTVVREIDNSDGSIVLDNFYGFYGQSSPTDFEFAITLEEKGPGGRKTAPYHIKFKVLPPVR